MSVSMGDGEEAPSTAGFALLFNIEMRGQNPTQELFEELRGEAEPPASTLAGDLVAGQAYCGHEWGYGRLLWFMAVKGQNCTSARDAKLCISTNCTGAILWSSYTTGAYFQGSYQQ